MFRSSRADGDTSWRKAAAGPPPGDERGSARFGGRGGGGGGGGYRRNDNRGSTGPPSGERSRLNLKKKGEAGDAPDLKDEEPVEEKTRREPPKINPRAAAFGEAPSGRSNMVSKTQRENKERGCLIAHIYNSDD